MSEPAALLREILACPRHRTRLLHAAAELTCEHGCRYAIVDGVPVLLLDDADPTHPEYVRSLRRAAGLADEAEPPALGGGGIDPFVQRYISATNGRMYFDLIGKLTRYPIPDLRAPAGTGAFLDIGCNWGRWCVAAARLGYRAIGIDPSLRAVLAARRVAAQHGVDASFVVADARHLPLQDGCVQLAHSYSVLQHLAKSHVRQALREVRRVLAPGGRSMVQLPSTLGLVSACKIALRGSRRPTAFDVRYWTREELRATFERLVGPSALDVDGYFTLNAQPADVPLLPWRYAMVVRASEALRRASSRRDWLARWADSVTVTSRKAS
jgi:ubiquinone/menaquinone biosynthesis C-methylase UbiE/uncharacterized protein YbaR (Trm112 family)